MLLLCPRSFASLLPVIALLAITVFPGGRVTHGEDDPRTARPKPPQPELEQTLPAGAILRVGGLADGALYGGMYRLLFTPDGARLITRDYSQAIRVWDLASGKVQHKLKGHESYVKALELSPDGNYLVSATADPKEDVRVWDINLGQQVRAIAGGGKLVQFLPDLTTLVIVSEDRIANYDMATGALIGEFPEVRIPLALSPDGKHLAALQRLDAEKLILFNTANGEEAVQLPGLTANPVAVRFSPDGKLLAVAGRREELVRVWDIAQRKVVMTLGNSEATNDAQRYDVQDIAFTSDNRFVATGCWDHGVRIFELVSGEQIAKLSGHADKVVAVEFSADGRLLASGSAGRTDASAVVWRVQDALTATDISAEQVNEKSLESAWTQLGIEDPAEAYGAVGTLLQDAKKGMAFIKVKLDKKLTPAPVEQIEKLINDLDSSSFATREKATVELTRLRIVAETLLRNKLSEEIKPEVRFRINKILESEPPPSKLTAEQWRQMRRLVYALELMAGSDTEIAKHASEFLTLMSIGHADVKVMREADLAVKRLGG